MSLNLTECSPAETAQLVFQDKNISVFGVPILPDTESAPSPSSLKRKASFEGSSPESIRAQVVRQTFRGVAPATAAERIEAVNWRLHRRRLPMARRATSSVSYIVLGPVIRGKFDAARATQLGVVGRARGLLIKGESVLSKDGVTLVTPEMCIGPSIPASVCTQPLCATIISSFDASIPQTGPGYHRLS